MRLLTAKELNRIFHLIFRSSKYRIRKKNYNRIKKYITKYGGLVTIDTKYVCMFTNCFPTKIPKAHLNFEKGDTVQMDIELRCTKYETPAINDINIWYLNNSCGGDKS